MESEAEQPASYWITIERGPQDRAQFYCARCEHRWMPPLPMPAGDFVAATNAFCVLHSYCPVPELTSAKLQELRTIYDTGQVCDAAERAPAPLDGLQVFQHALHDVICERAKQRRKWGDAHDDAHTDYGLSFAAAELAMSVAKPSAPLEDAWGLVAKHNGGIIHPWDMRARTRLVIAAALLVAEIERIDRKWKREDADHGS